jgi:hypothetical protein
MPVWSQKANQDMTNLVHEHNETPEAMVKLRQLINQWADQHSTGLQVQKFSGNGLRFAVAVTVNNGEVITVEHR